ncbi:MAG TPA: carbohydrate ABC transporter permease [Clostridiales bacterium]|nr:carbohydrate ABC transporter permease [Clostridiales bacterium]
MSRILKKTLGDKIFDVVNYIFMFIFCLTILLPFIHLLAQSFDKVGNISAEGLYIWPEEFTFDNYKMIAKNRYIWNGYYNTFFRTIVGTGMSLFFTSMGAYALSKKRFPNRTFWTMVVVFTMFFSGGLIPTFLWIKKLGLLDKRMVLILPGLIGAYNLVLIRNFFQQIPGELEESARIDGARDFTVFLRIILPVSKPILATVALWLAVGHWNAWFDCLVYIKDTKKYVVQVILQRIILQGTQQMMMDDTMVQKEYESRPDVIKAACIYFTTIPILCVYPFLQKYFVKGVFIGSLKG